jgi:hypothetical protein
VLAVVVDSDALLVGSVDLTGPVPQPPEVQHIIPRPAINSSVGN